ncbi:MAG: hypothetical protein WCF82_16605 [Microcoleus sp.]
MSTIALKTRHCRVPTGIFSELVLNVDPSWMQKPGIADRIFTIQQ